MVVWWEARPWWSELMVCVFFYVFFIIFFQHLWYFIAWQKIVKYSQSAVLNESFTACSTIFLTNRNDSNGLSVASTPCGSTLVWASLRRPPPTHRCTTLMMNQQRKSRRCPRSISAPSLRHAPIGAIFLLLLLLLLVCLCSLPKVAVGKTRELADAACDHPRVMCVTRKNVPGGALASNCSQWLWCGL